MIKECPVILSNEAVTVVDFDGKHVQLSAAKQKAKKVFVKFEDNKYSLSDEAEYEKEKNTAKKAKKKTTIEETETVDEAPAEHEISPLP